MAKNSLCVGRTAGQSDLQPMKAGRSARFSDVTKHGADNQICQPVRDIGT